MYIFVYAMELALVLRLKLSLYFREAEWNKAFNFSSNLDFLASCLEKTEGTISIITKNYSVFCL